MPIPDQLTASEGLRFSVSPPAPRNICIIGADGKPVVTIHPDGRMVLDRPELADEAAHVFADFVTSLLRPRLAPEESRADHS